MEPAVYDVVPRGEEWFVIHDGNEAGPYLTKEAAFQAVVPPISLTIAEGTAVQLNISAGRKDPTEHGDYNR